MRADRLSPAPVDEIVDVMADAFRGYPVMRFVVGSGGDAGEVAARERRLVDLFVRRRIARGGPAFGVCERGQAGGVDIAGAAVLTLPVEPDPPAEVAEMAAAAWRDLGDDARLRYEVYAAAASTVGVAEPHHHLNMIGVRPVHLGKGLSRPLIEAVLRLAEVDQASAGVSLTTEMPRNVDLYRHFGFDVTGEADVAPGLHTWGMFRRIR